MRPLYLAAFWLLAQFAQSAFAEYTWSNIAGSPGVSGSAGIATSALAPQVGSSGNNLTITFRRIADPSLTYQVWASSNLTDWGVTPIWSSTSAQNTAGPVTVTDPSTMGTRRFLRLKVLAP